MTDFYFNSEQQIQYKNDVPVGGADHMKDSQLWLHLPPGRWFALALLCCDQCANGVCSQSNNQAPPPSTLMKQRVQRPSQGHDQRANPISFGVYSWPYCSGRRCRSRDEGPVSVAVNAPEANIDDKLLNTPESKGPLAWPNSRLCECEPPHDATLRGLARI